MHDGGRRIRNGLSGRSGRRLPAWRDASHVGWLLVLAWVVAGAARADDPPASLGKVYGEWRIQIKPDKGAEYDALIESRGLPLFRAAGGRMVGWWKTLVGNLYEHVTIWEYDDMAAFEKAIGFLGPNADFAEFVLRRDPLLSGEENRFLRLPAGGAPPTLHDPAKFVIHETHRIPLKRQREHLDFLRKEGLPLLEKHGFRVVGPWLTSIGDWTEATLLFRFESLAERDSLVAKFSATDEGKRYGARISDLAESVKTRLLLPAAFAKPPAEGGGKEAKTTNRPDQPASPLLPHFDQVAPGVYAIGFADKFRSANCGVVARGERAALIDLPRGVPAAEFVQELARLTGARPLSLFLTHADPQDLPLVRQLVEAGVQRVIVTPECRQRLLGDGQDVNGIPLKVYDQDADFDDSQALVRFLPADGTAATGCASVAVPGAGVLFAGPLVVHGPRAALAGSETAAWIARLRELEALRAAHVVPGYGSWTADGAVTRQRRFLEELRAQVAYAVALGKPPEALAAHVRISPDFQVWMPYDNPVAEDLLYVYRELTVPVAPFAGREPRAASDAPQALVLIGDGPHEPQHLEQGLRPAFAAAGITPHFTVDVRALSAENLARVDLLVVLRDGLMRPTDDPQSFSCWVTKEHERAVVEFVERGGGFLNLHNALGLYPDDGPYLRLAGGRYIGHGPLERFRVEPVDLDHPITRGIAPFSVADEQHTPVVEAERVQLLLRSRSDGGIEGAAGWVREPGAGRLCHLASGHTRDALLHPTYQQLLRNALRWCAGRG